MATKEKTFIRGFEFQLESTIEDRKLYAKHIGEKHLLSKKFYNFGLALRGEPYETNDGMIKVDVVAAKNARDRLRIPPEKEVDAQKLLNFISGISEVELDENGKKKKKSPGKFRGIVSTLCGNRRKKESDGKCEGTKAACELLLAKVLPIIQTSEVYTSDHYYSFSQSGENFRSYLKCSTSTSQNYKNAENELEGYQEEYQLNLLEEKRDQFNLWLNEIKKLNSFSINPKFLSGWKKRFAKAITNNKKMEWSLGEEGIKIFQKYRSLFVNEENQDYILLFGYEFLMLEKLKRLKDKSSLTFPDMLKAPQFCRHGDNFDKFSMVQEGKEIFLLLTTCFAGIPQLKMRIKPHKKTSVWQLEGTEVPYRIAFKRPSDKDVRYLNISEVVINYNRNYANAVGEDRFLAGDTGPLSVFLISNIPDQTSDLECGIKFFTTALCNPTTKTEDKFPENLRVAFVDIGINPISSVKIYDYDRHATTGDFLVRKGKDEEDYGYGTLKDYFQIGYSKYARLKADIKALDNMIWRAKVALRFYKNISRLAGYNRVVDLELIQDLYAVPQDALKSFNCHKLFGLPDNDIDLEEAIKLVAENATDEKLLELKNQVVGYTNMVIKPEFKRLRLEKRLQDDIGCEYYYWLFTVKNYIDLNKSITYSNSKPLERGERRNPQDFSTLQRYFNNLSKDVLRKIASSLARKLIEKNVQVCIFEDLSSFKTSSANSSEKNKLLSIWSQSKVIDTYKQTLQTAGIVTDLADARHSSQSEPDSDRWACRDDKDKSKLWLSSQSEPINSDLAACSVLAQRWFTRFRDIKYIKTSKRGDVYLISIMGVRLKSYLQRIVGGTYAVIEAGVLKSIKLSEYERLSKMKNEGLVELYRHGDRWVDMKEHKILQERIMLSARGLE